MNVNHLANKYESFKKSFRKHSYLQITDNSELIIDGCRQIVLYDENEIRLLLAKQELEIAGMRMTMQNFSTDGVIIKGEIYSVKFINRKEE